MHRLCVSAECTLRLGQPSPMICRQVCGINPMASSEHGMVRAGVPVAGMPKSVRAVNAAGLTVVSRRGRRELGKGLQAAQWRAEAGS